MAQDLCSPLHCNICLIMNSFHPDLPRSDLLPPELHPLDLDVLARACNGCKLIRYCGKPHQELDWPVHKEFCSALQKLKKFSKIDHPFLVSGVPECREDIENTIVQLKHLVIQGMQRHLTFYEEELTSHPVYCPICYSLKNLTVLCPQCKNQIYCSEEHLLEHESEHVKVCPLMELYYSPLKTVPGNIDAEMVIKQKVEELEYSDLVEAIETAFQCTLPPRPTSSLKDYQLFSFAADFSCIGSICYALSHMNMSSYKSSNLVIFIIGASIEPAHWFREIHCKFLIQQHPQIKNLYLHFIGPEVVEPEANVLKFTFLNAERTVHFHINKCLFQVYCLNSKVKPNIIVAFNCGFSELSKHYNITPHVTDLKVRRMLEDESELLDDTRDFWYQGLVEALQTFHTPIIFTSLTKQEAEFDFAALQKVALRQTFNICIDRIFKVAKNPFHDLRPIRQWYIRDQEAFYYRNGYIQGIRTKLMT